MITRKPYIMKIQEIQTLIASLVSNGPEDTYSRMRAKAFMAMSDKNDVDEMFLDMSNTLLEKGREAANTSEKDSDNEQDGVPSVVDVYYTLSFLLRKLSHEVYRSYIKQGKKRNNSRFLRLHSHNKEAPALILSS